jgi:hypothetical protein
MENSLVAETTYENKKQSRPSRKSKIGLPELSSSFADRIQFLQRTVGNQSVERMIRSGTLQAKLKIAEPGDVYEKEADMVADQVMRMPEPQMAQSNNLHIQRACPNCEENELHRQPIKEDEEDKLKRQPIEEEDEKKMQRQPEEDEEKNVQAKEASDLTPEVNPGIENQIQSIKGGGSPLSENERTFFEPRFGADFSQVRVHTDTQAAEAAQGVNAKAFTMGHDIVFSPDQYNPGTSTGKSLLAHELTHVIQQNGNVNRRKNEDNFLQGNE